MDVHHVLQLHAQHVLVDTLQPQPHHANNALLDVHHAPIALYLYYIIS